MSRHILTGLPRLPGLRPLPACRPAWSRLAVGLAALVCGVVAGMAAPVGNGASGSRRPAPAWPLPEHPVTGDFFRAHLLEEPLVPVGGEPSPEENADLAMALSRYAHRPVPDDCGSLTRFLGDHPGSPWTMALLTNLGLEYYRAALYSRAIEAWAKAWELGRTENDLRARALVDRAVGELAYMYARLGRITELESLLGALEKRPLKGAATERITGAREGLWNMRHHPEVSFKCGPYALQSIQRHLHPQDRVHPAIAEAASTPLGFSLPEVADLSRRIGMGYQMALRGEGGGFIAPSVVHWKVGHYAAILRREGDLYLLQDPTFGNTVWATRQALEAETSGYFLVPPGPLPKGWRPVRAEEAAGIRGRGFVSSNDPRATSPRDLRTPGALCLGMPVASVHLMAVSLNVADEPVGYAPPVGPDVPFIVRYNQRDAFQPSNFNFSSLGLKWTCDWISYISDNPSNVLADVNCYMRGGGDRTFQHFDAATGRFAPQTADQTRLTRLSSDSYELLWRDGSRWIYDLPDGSVGSARRVFLTRVLDPAGNAVRLDFDDQFRLVSITDAIGQVTTVAYPATNSFLVSQVTDPFGRFASFRYDQFARLTNITDVAGLSSRFRYRDINVINPHGELVNIIPTDAMVEMVTPYGTNTFEGTDTVAGENTRFVQTTYPDGSRDRVEYNQTVPLAAADPLATVPVGVSTLNNFLQYRNTFYWDRAAFGIAAGDYGKARLFHWLHSAALGSAASGTLESSKEPLENRVWYDYAGQGVSPTSEGSNSMPTHIARVLDDGTTQLRTYAYNSMGHKTLSVDPVGRTMVYRYETNDIDLVEIRQQRAGNDELLFRATYNNQHLPVTVTDAAGQTARYTYNARGQMLTATDARNGTVTFGYDPRGYLIQVDGVLPGTDDLTRFSYDELGRLRSATDVNGYTLRFTYNNLDQVTRIDYPDGSFEGYTYHLLDVESFRDRAGKETRYAYDRLRQLTRVTDPMGLEMLFDFCACGSIRSVTDPLGRTTQWLSDVQGRRTAKRYPDGSEVRYCYEKSTSRLQKTVDEKGQSTLYAYNFDDSVQSIRYPDARVPTPGVRFTYDPDYPRLSSMTDGTGTTVYRYQPVTVPPLPGAGSLVSVDGPLPADEIRYVYDELRRPLSTFINGVGSGIDYDPAGRVRHATNVLGTFAYAYDGASGRLVSEASPNGQTRTRSYAGAAQDFHLLQQSYDLGGSLLEQTRYEWDVPNARVTSMARRTGGLPESASTFGYDDLNQLVTATVTRGGAPAGSFGYAYDRAGNRSMEQIGSVANPSAHNALNQVTSAALGGGPRTNEWDAAHRLVAVTDGARRTEFAYDGMGHCVLIRQRLNGSEVSVRRFVWCDGRVCEERDATGAHVLKRFLTQGVRVEEGPGSGSYYYARDHLGSVQALTDGSGAVRARYDYDPYGRRTQVSGDVSSDIGFAGMFSSEESGLLLTHFRAYSPELGRWLSRDPLPDAELLEGPNLYAYADNNPVNRTDPTGLSAGGEIQEVISSELAEHPSGGGIVEHVPSGDIRELIQWESRALETEIETQRYLQVLDESVDFELYLNKVIDELPRFRPTDFLPRRPPLRKVPSLQPRQVAPSRSPRATMTPGLGGAITLVIDAGITILTMTDCNTVNGILGLVRQGRGGVLNVYEDRMLKELENYH